MHTAYFTLMLLSSLWGFRQITPESQSAEDAVLKGLKTINFAHPVPTEDWVRRLVRPEEINSLALEILRRYKIPIQATPLTSTRIGDSIGYTLPPAPVLDFNISTHTTTCGTNCVINTADLRLELWDEVKLVRNPDLGRKLILPIWSTSGDPADDRQAVLDSITRMVERFCLAYLNANRP